MLSTPIPGILPEWNVNQDRQGYYCSDQCPGILPEWNVNYASFKDFGADRHPRNLTRMECKSVTING